MRSRSPWSHAQHCLLRLEPFGRAPAGSGSGTVARCRPPGSGTVARCRPLGGRQEAREPEPAELEFLAPAAATASVSGEERREKKGFDEQ